MEDELIRKYIEELPPSNINLITDASTHNFALMQISTFAKQYGHKTFWNGVGKFDFTIGSFLFKFSEKGFCDFEGGPGIDSSKSLLGFDKMKPDYDLINIDYSIGYSWRYCPRKCPFCEVPKQNNSKEHKSIWTFHNSKFDKICLLNNNTFSDPQWRETFEEIWDAKLSLIEHGFDVRLMTEEKAVALKRTKIISKIHYAWDLMEYEEQVMKGLYLAPAGLVYVLVGYNTTFAEDMYRCERIHEVPTGIGTKGIHRPYIMIYDRKRPELTLFKNFIESRMYYKYPTFKDAWNDYKKGNPIIKQYPYFMEK